MPDSVSIIVITYRRAQSVGRCLEQLARQVDSADQIIVVDASEDRLTADVVAAHDNVVYVRNDAGIANMTSSRNVGLRFAWGEILAFLDDDAYVEPEYVSALRRAYADPTVALACSRTLSCRRSEGVAAPEGVGRLLDDGRLIGNFDCNLGACTVVDIDHGIGATMSFRRATLHAMGGFREDYGGISGVREDADAFLRARRLGLRAVFVSDAVAHHVGAPQAKGRRFDLRYEYWAARNHALLLSNNFGLANPLVPRSAIGHVKATLADRSRPLVRRSVRALVATSGFIRGISIALIRRGGRPLPARLDDAAAEDLRARLIVDSLAADRWSP